MSAIITNKLKIHQASKFKSSLNDEDSNMYLFVGKSDPWPNDAEPPTSLDTIIDEHVRWNSMIALKKVIDITHAIPKHLWDETGETIYVEYSDNDPNLFLHPTQEEVAEAGSDYTAGSFYVITDEYHVYKCISNGGGQKSTIKPTGTSTSIIETADGYKWKYMYSVNTGDALKYETPDFIPVKTLEEDDNSAQWDVQNAAVDGSVEHFKVLDPGSGYENVHSGTCQNGAGANTVILASDASSENDYYNGCTIFIDDGQNAGQYRLIEDYDGASRLATLDSNWEASTPPDSTSSYEVTATVEISGGSGSGLTARAFIEDGEVVKINPITVGSGYRFSDGLTVTISGAGGSGAEARAVISPIGGHGKNAIEELGGYFTITNVRLNYNESKFISKNDYRIVGLIADVVDFGTTDISTSNNLSATKSMDCVSMTEDFHEDEEIEGGTSGAKAIVIESTEDLDNSTTSIRYYQNESTGFTPFQESETITGAVSGATATIDTLNDPDIEPYVGKILHVEQRRPLMRSVDQYEEIKIVLQH